MKDKADEGKMLVILKLSEAMTIYIQEAVDTWFESCCEPANIISVLVWLKGESEFWRLWKGRI